MAISDLPGYVQGYVFRNDPTYFNVLENYFIDQAGYKDFPASRLEITTGTPSFTAVNSTEGMVLDNTCQGFLNCPTLWNGSCIIVQGAPGTIANGDILYPYIGGGQAAPGNNGRILIAQSGTNTLHQILAPSNTTFGTITLSSDDGIHAFCMSMDQQNRTCEILAADGTANTSGAAAANEFGVDAFHDVGGGVAIYQERQRFGNISGTKDDFSATASTMIICEMHFFNVVLTNGDTADVEAELTALETIYG